MTQTPATVRAKNQRQRWQDAKAERVARTRKQNPRPPWAHPLAGKVSYWACIDNGLATEQG